MKNIIGIDPSLISTAMVVNDKKFVYTGRHVSHTEKGKLKQWFTLVESLMVINSVDLVNPVLPFSELELHKFYKYTAICDRIVSDIQSVVGVIDSNCYFGIEGYSYSSAAGPLIDLVTFGSILRRSLILAGATNILIIPPQELKVKCASMVYPETKKGKVVKYINPDGVSAGSFKKPDMLKCLLADPTLVNDAWVKMLKEHEVPLLALKTVPKPIEDMNDAKIMYEWIKRNS